MTGYATASAWNKENKKLNEITKRNESERKERFQFIEFSIVSDWSNPFNNCFGGQSKPAYVQDLWLLRMTRNSDHRPGSTFIMRTQFVGYLTNTILPKIGFLHIRNLNTVGVK
jgi:hypothetical protein